MRRLSLIIFLVCLMTSGAFAATKTWVGDVNGAGEWSADGNYWNPVGKPADTGSSNDYVKVEKSTVGDANVCTLNTVAGNFPLTKLTVAASNTAGIATLKITGGSIGTGNEFQVSDAGKKGSVIQTGGAVTTFSGKTAGKLEIGYKAGGVGSWTISDGSIGFGAQNVGQIVVGGTGAIGSEGTFTVIGDDATINTDKFLVGVKDNTGGYPGDGTVEFKLGDSVSPINVATSVTLDPIGTAWAELIVTLTDENAPPLVIPLIITSGSTAVLGKFDQVNSAGNGTGDEGDAVTLTTPLGVNYTNYWVTYKYNAGTGALTGGNDIALIPEPATIALLGLGSLIAIRRKRK